VQDAARLLRVTLPAGTELVVECNPGTPAVLADPTQIHQLLVNLCTNAWQAMQGRSGRIAVKLSGITPEAADMHAVDGVQPRGFARLSVSDSGTGIDPRIRERIFEPFFSTKSVGEGTGLGLAVVHGIVQAHEGAIEVQSEPGTGTTFHIVLPAAQPPAERHCHVLFLDDSEALVSAMVRMLSRRGYRVSGHTLAEQALEAVRAAPQAYDLVVSDCFMPGLSGLDVAREVARIRPDLPVVILSGRIDVELQRKARELGVREVLNKLDPQEELLRVTARLTGN